MAGDDRESVRPDELVDDLEEAADAIRKAARAQIGITGAAETEPLRKVLREEGVSLYPLVALSALATVNVFQGYALSVLSPDIARGLGVGIGAIIAARSLAIFAIALSPLPMAWLAQRKAWRAMLSILTGVGWSLLTIYTGWIAGLAGLIVVLIFDGLTTGSVQALHLPLLMDSYPPRVRVRALSAYAALGEIGLANVLSPLMVAGLVSIFMLTWRGVFVVMGILSLLGTTIAFRLRDPGFGHYDTERIRLAVHEAHGETAVALKERDVRLGFFEVLRRILLIPTARRLALGTMVLGIFAIPASTFISFFLDQRFGVGPTGRGFFFAIIYGCGALALVLFARRGEAIFRDNPARVLTLSGVLLSMTIILLGIAAVMPNLVAVTVVFALAFALQLVLNPLLQMALLSVVEARWRPHLTAIIGIFLSAGGFLGAFFLSGIQARFGLGGAIVSLSIPGVIGVLIFTSASRLLNDDIDRMLDEVVEEEEIARIRSSGGHLPMLACRGVDFSYGKLQVLFGVDFTVDEGEMVALLGVNGAGKSTLLKVVSGIGLPSRGSVRFQGQDITYLDAERRLRLGITQVPGGRAVFAPLSVVDNLRVYGYAMGRNGDTIDAAMDRCFQAFPRLAERRNQLASTLSGGEQQMLGLCKALILKPRLLLIDELSLGLAPIVVAQLLDIVRQINAEGTAVVIVEQSVNIALSVARHAYFMERGEVRFDGPSDELLARSDLLRAVFLQGAGGRAGPA